VHRLRPERRGGVLALAPTSRGTVLNGRKKDGVGAAGMEEAGADTERHDAGSTSFETAMPCGSRSGVKFCPRQNHR
jgi:hypothetical protein